MENDLWGTVICFTNCLVSPLHFLIRPAAEHRELLMKCQHLMRCTNLCTCNVFLKSGFAHLTKQFSRESEKKNSFKGLWSIEVIKIQVYVTLKNNLYNFLIFTWF